MQLLRDLWLLVKCYPVARRRVLKLSEDKYPGVVRTQIAYNEVRTELIKKGYKDDSITGAIIYIAVSLAYLTSVR
jgi:hypothetical protein